MTLHPVRPSYARELARSQNTSGTLLLNIAKREQSRTCVELNVTKC